MLLSIFVLVYNVHVILYILPYTVILLTLSYIYHICIAL